MTLQQRFRISIAAYAVLAVLIGTTLSNDPIGRIAGQAIGLRAIAGIVLAMFVVKTLLHWKAEQIRAADEKQ